MNTEQIFDRHLMNGVPTGLGASLVEHSGLGASLVEKPTFTVIAPVMRKSWAMVYALGDASARVKIAGQGFDCAQVLQGFVASGLKSQYFLYKNGSGSYLFACGYVGGVPCIQLATDALTSVGMGRVPEGLGKTLTISATTSISPRSTPPNCAGWVQVTPSDPNNFLTNVAQMGVDLPTILVQMGALNTALQGVPSGSTVDGFGLASDGDIYFDYNNGNAGTNGGPPGVYYMRYHVDSTGTPVVGVCPFAGPAVSTPTVQSPAAQPPAVQSGGTTTDQGTYSWSGYMWIYQAAGSNDAPGLHPPPGQVSGAAGQWINTTGNQFDWYPTGVPGATSAQLGSVIDPSGNTWWVYSSASGAKGVGAPPAYNPPVPGSTVPPTTLPGATGSWSAQLHPYYQVWVPGVAATTSTAEIVLLALLGFGTLGGIAYLVWD
jgi:hypothetical protein